MVPKGRLVKVVVLTLNFIEDNDYRIIHDEWEEHH